MKKLREILLEAKKDDDDKNGNGKNGKNGNGKNGKNGNGKNGKNGKMLNGLHSLDDQIEEFIDDLEDKINAVEDNPVFVKKAHQLLADMSKEYSEFIMALRAIVNAVDRKGQVLPTFDQFDSKVRDVNSNAGNEMPEEQGQEEEPPPEEEEGGDEEFVIAKKDKKKGKKKDKKKSPVKEALER